MEQWEEIKTAIEGLSPVEYRCFADWFHERDQLRWDEELDRDSSSDKLGFLFAEAADEESEGLLREWPPTKGRMISEVIADLESRGSKAVIDDDFARDIEEGIKSLNQPWNPPSGE